MSIHTIFDHTAPLAIPLGERLVPGRIRRSPSGYPSRHATECPGQADRDEQTLVLMVLACGSALIVVFIGGLARRVGTALGSATRS